MGYHYDATSCFMASANVFIFKAIMCVNSKISLTIPKGDNQNPYIEEEQTPQWPKEKVQKTNNDLLNIHIKLKIEYSNTNPIKTRR